MQAKVSYTSFFKLTCVRAVKGYKNMIIPFQTDIYHNQIRNTWWIRENSVIFTTGSGRLLRVQYIDGCTSQFWKVKKRQFVHYGMICFWTTSETIAKYSKFRVVFHQQVQGTVGTNGISYITGKIILCIQVAVQQKLWTSASTCWTTGRSAFVATNKHGTPDNTFCKDIISCNNC